MNHAASPHELLLRHFRSWADEKHKQVDLDLVEELLWLRSSYDDLEPTYWPEGSAEHLLLERWPAKGDVTPPDPETLETSLDAWFRFLRGTGRMSTKSATPKELTKEVRRSARQMAEVAADPANWSPTKVLLDFGRRQGIDVDDAPDQETLQARLAEVQARWNALPMAERQRLMPGPVQPRDGADWDDDWDDEAEGEADEEPEGLTGCERAMIEHGTDDPIQALLLALAETTGPLDIPAHEQVAACFRDATFYAKLKALADWVGHGKELTATGVLRPAAAREVHDLLGLDAWTRAQLERQYPDEHWAGVRAVGRQAWIEDLATRRWTSAKDCGALDRLWFAAVQAGAVEVAGRKAVRAQAWPSDTAGWTQLGLDTTLAVVERLSERPWHVTQALTAMLISYTREAGPVTRDEVAAFVRDWERTPEEIDRADAVGYDIDYLHRTHTEVAIGELEDLGLFVDTDEGLVLTAAGVAFLTLWISEAVTAAHVADGGMDLADLAGLDDLDEEALLAAWDEVDRDAAALVRETCADHLAGPAPVPALARAAQELREGVARGGWPFDYFRNACGWAEGTTTGDEELWTAAAAATVSPPEDPQSDDIEVESSVMALDHADWFGMVVGLVRRGVGATFDEEAAIRDIEECPELEGEVPDEDGDGLIAVAAAALTPRWRALGILDDEDRLTELGAWGLPRALVRAWDTETR